MTDQLEIQAPHPAAEMANPLEFWSAMAAAGWNLWDATMVQMGQSLNIWAQEPLLCRHHHHDENCQLEVPDPLEETGHPSLFA